MNYGLRRDGDGEDVDGDCPLPMRGALVMTMAMISPTGREVSPVEQLCRSSRLDPPRFRLMAAESRPEKFLLIFFSWKYFILEKMDVGEPPGGPWGRGRALGGAPSWAGCGPPGLHLWRGFFFIYFKMFHGVSRLLELRRIGLQYLLLFQPKIRAASILPLHVNLVK